MTNKDDFMIKCNDNALGFINEKDELILKLACDNKVGEVKTVFIFIYEKSKANPMFSNELIVAYKIVLMTGLFIRPTIKLGKETVLNLNLTKDHGLLRLMQSNIDDFKHSNLNLMLDPDDNSYYMNLVTIKRSHSNGIYLNMIDTNTKTVKYPIIIKPNLTKPKIDRFINLKVKDEK